MWSIFCQPEYKILNSYSKLNLCDDSDVYIVVRGITTVKGINNAKKSSKKKVFKNSASFRLCISKINKN